MSGPDGWWPTSEPPHRINQIYLEPILLEHTAKLPGVTLLNRTQVTTFAQDADGVVASAIDLDSGTARRISARYMVGCDGGRSQVRKQIGAKLEGTAIIQRVQSTYIRAPKLMGLIPGKPAWSCYAMNPRRCGTVFAIDGKQDWLVHNHLNLDEPEFDSVDRDQSIRNILGVGADFEYEVLSKEDWVGRRLVADRFRNGNVFLAGDAAHLWMPCASTWGRARMNSTCSSFAAPGLTLATFMQTHPSSRMSRKHHRLIQNGRLHPVHRAGLPRAALLAGGWAVSVRRLWAGLHAAAV